MKYFPTFKKKNIQHHYKKMSTAVPKKKEEKREREIMWEIMWTLSFAMTVINTIFKHKTDILIIFQNITVFDLINSALVNTNVKKKKKNTYWILYKLNS